MKKSLTLLFVTSCCIAFPCRASEEKRSRQTIKETIKKSKKKNLLKGAESSWSQHYGLIKPNSVATTMLAGCTIAIFGLRYAPLQERIIFPGMYKPISPTDAIYLISKQHDYAKQRIENFDKETKDIKVTLKEYETELIPGKTIKLFGIHYQFNKNDHDNKNKKVILMFHGNARNAFHRYGLGLELAKITGYDTFIASYPGYGINEGKIRCEQDFYKATEAAYEHLCKEKSDGGLDYQEKNTTLLSCSIGGSAAINIASQKKYNPASLALVAPFTSIPDFRWWLKPFVYPIVRYPLDNLSKITKVRCRILIAHDVNDSIIPYSHSKKLVDAIKEKNKKRISVKVPNYNGGHCINTALMKELKRFLIPKGRVPLK